MDEINKALRYTPDNPKLLFLRGNVYLSMKKGKSVVRDLKRSCAMGYRQACMKVKNIAQKRLKRQ